MNTFSQTKYCLQLVVCGYFVLIFCTKAFCRFIVDLDGVFFLEIRGLKDTPFPNFLLQTTMFLSQTHFCREAELRILFIDMQFIVLVKRSDRSCFEQIGSRGRGNCVPLFPLSLADLSFSALQLPSLFAYSRDAHFSQGTL